MNGEFDQDFQLEGLSDLELSENQEDASFSLEEFNNASKVDFVKNFNSFNNDVIGDDNNSCLLEDDDDLLGADGEKRPSSPTATIQLKSDLDKRESDLKMLLSILGQLFAEQDFSLGLSRSTCGSRANSLIDACNRYVRVHKEQHDSHLELYRDAMMERDQLLARITELKDSLGIYNSKIAVLQDEVLDYRTLADSAGQQRYQDTTLIDSLKRDLGSRDTEIVRLKGELAPQDDTIRALNLHIKQSSATALNESTREHHQHLLTIGSLNAKVSSLESTLSSNDTSSQQLIKSLKGQLSTANLEIGTLQGAAASTRTSAVIPQLVNLQEQYPYQFLLYKKQCVQEIKVQHAIEVSELESVIAKRLESHHSKSLHDLDTKNTAMLASITRDYEEKMVSARESCWSECRKEVVEDCRVKHASTIDALTRTFEQKMVALRSDGECQRVMQSSTSTSSVEELKATHSHRISQLKDQYYEALESVKRESVELLHQRVLESGRVNESRIRDLESVHADNMGGMRERYVVTLERVRDDVRNMRQRQEVRLREEFQKRGVVERELRKWHQTTRKKISERV